MGRLGLASMSGRKHCHGAARVGAERRRSFPAQDENGIGACSEKPIRVGSRGCDGSRKPVWKPGVEFAAEKRVHDVHHRRAARRPSFWDH